jgi:magnesium chelatase family protein
LDAAEVVDRHSSGPSGSSSNSPGDTALLPLGLLQERILKIAAIGRHHLLILGPKGSGKSALLDWFRAVAPPGTPTQAWERALFQESRGEGPDFSPPIRRVHSQVRPAHLLGNFTSGTFRAGELSLSHGGILFADEFPEWPRDAKECLREPLESERILLTRTRGSHQAKCELQLIASGNLCPCGGFPSRLKSLGLQSRIRCRCTESDFFGYLKRLSGPILDRIDLIPILQEPRLPDFSTRPDPERILIEIRKKQQQAISKWGALPSRLHPEVLEMGIKDSPPLLKRLESLESLRSRHKTLRLARTIQILDESTELRLEHLLEACSYRWLDSFL